MRNVWLRIGLGAFGIFLVGMIVVKVFRVGREQVVSLVDSDDPIVVPLMGVVPFQLGAERLGDLRRVTLLRDAPDHIIGVKVVARLSDSATVEPFKDCAFLTLTNGAGTDSTGELKVNEHSRFRCIGDTSAMGSFGTVEIRHTQGKEPTTFVRTLVLPPEVIADIQRAMSNRHTQHGVDVEVNQDSIRAMVDSITTDALQRAEAARAAPAPPAPPATP